MIEIGDLIHWQCDNDRDVGIIVEIKGDAKAYKYKIRWSSTMQDQWVADFMFESIMIGTFTIVPNRRR